MLISAPTMLLRSADVTLRILLGLLSLADIAMGPCKALAEVHRSPPKLDSLLATTARWEGNWTPGCSDSVCRLRSERRPKLAPHTPHTNGRFFWCTLCTCRFKSDFRPNGMEQMSHSNFLECSCTICTCFFSTPLRPNAMSQTWHRNGFCSSCTVMMWRSRFGFWWNEKPHWSHVHGLWPSWMFWMCRSRWCLRRNREAHISQSKLGVAATLSSISWVCSCKDWSKGQNARKR